VQYGKASLVCDFQELYRVLIDDYVIQFCEHLRKKDFTLKNERLSRKRMLEKQFLKDAQTREFLSELNRYFESMVSVARVKHGDKQSIESLIREEALLFARFLDKKLILCEQIVREFESSGVKYARVRLEKISDIYRSTTSCARSINKILERMNLSNQITISSDRNNLYLESLDL